MCGLAVRPATSALLWRDRTVHQRRDRRDAEFAEKKFERLRRGCSCAFRATISTS